MSKAVMISIRPKWCEKICNGEKTIEVRKTRTKLETPFKCYIYCTMGHPYISVSCGELDKLNYRTNTVGRCNGKVIGEFTCDRIDWITHIGYTGIPNLVETRICDAATMRTSPVGGLLNAACLTPKMLNDYLAWGDGYGWHISDLVIYDEPKELIEFHTWKKCKSCSKSGYESTACIYDENCMIPAAITKAPQIWCYVEEDF